MSWKTLSFDDCLERVKTPPKLQKNKYLDKGKFPVVAQEDSIINGYTNDENLIFKINSPIIIFGDHTRRLKYIDFNFVLGADGAKIIKPKSEINVKFFYYYLTLMMPKNIGYARHYKLLKNIKFNIPSLAEQQHIVDKLEATFTDIEKVISNIELNIKNTKNIYQNAFDNLFEKEFKRNVPIGNFSKINYGYTSKSSHEKGSYKILRITDIQGGTVSWDTVPMCEVKKNKLKNVLLHDGDIVFARTGATTGKSHLLLNPKNSVFASYLIRLSVDRAKFLPKYIYHYFQSSNYWKQINEGISGAAQGGFNASKLSNLQIPLIDLKKQEETREYLDNISYETETLTNLYQLKIKKLIKLKLSILKQKLNKAA